MNQPNFLIVGASKSGTTSLWHYLNEHPDIYLPKPKEPLFFIIDKVKNYYRKDPAYLAAKDNLIYNFEDYQNLFTLQPENIIKGEASASYLYYYKTAVGNIKKYLAEEPKIIIILREPVKKVISHFTFYKCNGWEPHSFEKALALEHERKSKNYNPFYHYTSQGFYYDSVKYYIENFKKVHVCFYDDLKDNLTQFLNEIFNFLEVKEFKIKGNKTEYNKSFMPKHNSLNLIVEKNRKFHAFLKKSLPFINWSKIRQKVIQFNKLEDFSIDESTYKQLKELYKEDVNKLQELLQVDLLNKWGY